MSDTDRSDAAQREPVDRAALLRDLDALRGRVSHLEELLEGVTPRQPDWQRGYYATYYATTGFLLGMIAAALSLLFNVIGSVMFPSLQGTAAHPLRLIQVYLTFPLGERALSINSGLTLAVGCCLYLATGAVYGIPFNLVLHRWSPKASLGRRLLLASGLSLAVWLVNFYGILSWLQPLLFQGQWIVELVPWWVAALTHLIFGWTMALVYPWGEFSPYRVTTEA